MSSIALRFLAVARCRPRVPWSAESCAAARAAPPVISVATMLARATRRLATGSARRLSTLVVAEHDGASISEATLSAVTAASSLGRRSNANPCFRATVAAVRSKSVSLTLALFRFPEFTFKRARVFPTQKKFRPARDGARPPGK